jgi:hypothetical protein
MGLVVYRIKESNMSCHRFEKYLPMYQECYFEGKDVTTCEFIENWKTYGG